MAHCTKCGQPLEENSLFCTSCGEQVEQEQVATVATENEEQQTNEQTTQQEQQKEEKKEQTGKKSFIDKIKAWFDTPDAIADFDKEDVEKNKGMAVCSYIGLLFLLPLLMAKDSKYARFHANQGIVFCIATILVGIVAGILALIPVIGWIVDTAISIAVLAFWVVGILNAYNGKAKRLPLIGKFDILKEKKD